MKRRRFDPRRAKIHHSYEMREIAILFGVHKRTVRNWIAKGLPVIDDRRPYLVHGADLRAFLSKKRTEAKQPCGPGRIYCVKCREPKAPAGAMVDYLPLTESTGDLRGLCPDCDTLIHRRVSLAKISKVAAGLDVKLPEAHRHIRGSFNPSLNCTFEKE